MTTCALCSHRLDGGTLCTACTHDTMDRLGYLPRMWRALEACLAPSSTGQAQYGGRTPRAEAPLPVREEVLNLRADGGIVGVLEDWHTAVLETRSLPVPSTEGSLAHRVSAAAYGLRKHVYFIAVWDHGGDLGRDVQTLVHRVRAVIDPRHDEDKPTLLGHCIAVLPTGAICGARLYADMTRTVQCTRCRCPYPPDRWLALRHHQPGARPLAEADRPAS